jgi:hypothetical protein
MEQLRQARNDVIQIDPGKPIVIRAYSWDLNERPFGKGKPYEAGIADILIFNQYSNYMENGKLQWPTVIEDSTADFARAIKAVDPRIKIWIAIAAFEEAGKFNKPTVEQLSRDIKKALTIPEIDALSFFEWGPSYPDSSGRSWYLPETGPELWDAIKKNIWR